MDKQKILENYLVGENGYLKSDISNGKVIMLSGKWGSGKTHFWQNKIQTVLSENKIPNHYISLYGKTSIQEIKNEIFLKIFESVDSCDFEEKGKKFTKNAIDLFSLFTKSVGIDLSKFTDKLFENLEKILKDKKLNKTVEYLNNGAIICFDDFERKSKDIDLNDLFGFITQLTLNFSCKIVIILNDDVFEGIDKKVFSHVKEKSVSKFLKYEPSIKELFETIFSDNGYIKLDNYKEIILKTIEETKELNARIYIQVLDNLVEWVEKNQEANNEALRCLILVNINFILFHNVFKIENIRLSHSTTYKNRITIKNKIMPDNIMNLIYENNINKSYEVDLPLIEHLKIQLKGDNNFEIFSNELKSLYFAYSLKVLETNDNNEIDEKLFKQINSFVETGILERKSQ